MSNVKTALKIIGGVLLAGVTVFGMTTCITAELVAEQEIKETRATNGGVVPGKEALDNNGLRHNVTTIHHNGNEYTCFSRGYLMGCAKE